MTTPYVSIIVAVRNEEAHLAQCLDSLLMQTYQNVEIIVVDGRSDDATPDIINKFTTRYPKKIRSYVNSEQRVAQGRNIGYAKAKGNYIGFIDGHTYAHKKWLGTLVEALEQSSDKVGGIGSVHFNADTKPFTIATTLVLSSFLGGGGTSYKPGKKLRAVQTAYAVLYKKEALWSIKKGEEFYNSYFIKGQDAEMNIRIRKKGYVILQHPQAKTYYYKRPTLHAFWRQMVNAGFWRAKIVKQHPDTITKTSTVFLPLLFFIGIIALLLLGFVNIFFSRLGSILLGLYVLTLFLYMLSFIIKKKNTYYTITFLLFLSVHAGYSWGLLKGFCRQDSNIFDRVKQ